MNEILPKDISNSRTLEAMYGDNKILFQLKMEGNNFLISTEIKDSLIPDIYEGIFTLQEIKNNNKYFLQFENNQEIFNELIYKSEKGYSIINRDNNNFVLKILLYSSKFQDIEFILKTKIKSYEDKLKELYTMISEVKNENFELKHAIDNLKTENSQLKENNKLLFDSKNKESRKIENKNKPKKSKKNIIDEGEKKSIKQSLILNGDEEKINQLNIFISPSLKFNSELIYQMTRDGKAFEKFHELCDNISPNLLLIKDDKENIFGGYTNVCWEKTDCKKTDPTSFLFSLNKNKKYYPRNKYSFQILCFPDSGPRFGSGNIGFQVDNMSLCISTRNGEYLDESLSTNEPGIIFSVKEVEFYHIIFNNY